MVQTQGCPDNRLSQDTIGAVATNKGRGIAGVAWRVSISPVRVLGCSGGSTDDLVDAIRWAARLRVDNVPVNSNPADIINMSLAGLIITPLGLMECSEETNEYLIDAIDEA
jgi:subtilisin family serine protease